MKKDKICHMCMLPLFLVAVAFVLSACKGTILDVSPTSPTPTPSKTTEIVPTPPPTAQATPPTQKEKSPVDYDPPEFMGNRGSNIENGGQALDLGSYIYYIEDGLYRFESYGADSQMVLDMPDIAYLNDVGEYIYFVSTDDYQVHRLHRKSGELQSLPVFGAYSLLILGEHLYFQDALAEGSNNHMFRADLNGRELTDLGFSATHFCPDDVYIYFSNLDDNKFLYRYHIYTGETTKVRSDVPRQINVIGEKMYYIAQNEDDKVVGINLNGAGRDIYVDDACESLNHVNEQLVFTRRSLDQLELYDLKTGTVTTLVEYPDINGIHAAGDWIFFEATVIAGSYDAVFRMDTNSNLIYPPLPEANLARITDFDARRKTLTVDYVEFLTGDEAVSAYMEDESVSKEDATNHIVDDCQGYYIRNRNPKQRTFKVKDYTAVRLVSLSGGTVDPAGYDTSPDTLFDLLETQPGLKDYMLLSVITMGDELISIDEFFTP